MKRIIRELITLIRIERWVVEEDQTSHADPMLPPPQPHALEVWLEETVLAADGRVLKRELFRRVLEVQQWDVHLHPSSDSQEKQNQEENA